jgi:hypothetical protein
VSSEYFQWDIAVKIDIISQYNKIKLIQELCKVMICLANIIVFHMS